MNNTKWFRISAFLLDFLESSFKEFPTLVPIWKRDLDKLTESQAGTYSPSESSKAFLLCISEISRENKLDLRKIEDWLFIYQKQIKLRILDYVIKDYNNQDTYGNRLTVTSLLEKSFVETSSAVLVNRLIESISKNEFDKTKEIPTLEIKEKSIKAIAQVRDKHPSINSQTPSTELQQWKQLTAEAITSMDDLTADIFDAVSLIWLEQAVHKDQMIKFHTDDALNLRKVQGRYNVDGYITGYRSSERHEVMKRLAALTSIYIKVEQDDLKFVEIEENDVVNIEQLQQVQFNPLFVVDSVTVVYRKGEPVGINECTIKPGNLLADFLIESKEKGGLLAMKTLQYNPIKQKYHKRLSRYLSWQWIMNREDDDVDLKHSIGSGKGLLQVMGMKIDITRGKLIKDKFEEILDTLEADNIIEHWEYVDFDESLIDGHRNSWFEKWWLNAKVIIIPPIGRMKLQETAEQEQGTYQNIIQELIFNPAMDSEEGEMGITPNMFKNKRKERKLTLKYVGEDLGISHTTLSRFERGLIKKPTEDNLKKIEDWYYKENA